MAPTPLVQLFLLASLPATAKALVPLHHPLIAATTTTCRPTTALQVDASAVNDLVQGLDLVLGNPTNAATAAADVAVNSNNNAMNMEISDAAIMLGGGVATLTVGALAAFFTTSNSDSEKDSEHELQQGRSSLTELQAQVQSEETPAAATEAIVEDKPAEEPAIFEAMEESITTELSKQEELEIQAAVKAEVAATAKEDIDPVVQETKQRGIFMQRILDKKSQLLQKANQKLRRQTAKLSTAESKLKETQSQLNAVTRSNQKLYEDYQTEKATVEAIKEELAQAQTRYAELQQSTEAELALMREANQDLEDKYELEQNDKKRRTSALREAEWTLDRTSKQFSKTKLELMKAKAELDKTQTEVKASNEILEDLQGEKQSLRKLTGNIWKLSKDRARQRLGKVKGKLSRKNQSENQ